MSFFCVDSVTAGYGKSNVIENLSFSMEKGTLVGVLGANGSGKTTLLKSICGILPHSGTCSLEDAVLENLSARQIARSISYIPQRSGITIDISTLDVVLMGFNPHLGLLEHPTQAMVEAAQTALEQVEDWGDDEAKSAMADCSKSDPEANHRPSCHSPKLGICCLGTSPAT